MVWKNILLIEHKKNVFLTLASVLGATLSWFLNLIDLLELGTQNHLG